MDDDQLEAFKARARDATALITAMLNVSSDKALPVEAARAIMDDPDPGRRLNQALSLIGGLTITSRWLVEQLAGATGEEQGDVLLRLAQYIEGITG